MVKRQLRVGDLVDDYCPRERRLTDHAIVAMVEDDVRQVRCAACSAEHEYREAKLPPTRKKKPAAGPPPLPPAGTVVVRQEPVVAAVAAAPAAAAADSQRPAEDPGEVGGEPDASAPHHEVPPIEGPVHRPLIRATLPRIEGQVPERRIPEFTMHNTGGRGPGPHGKSFRPGGHRPGGGKGQPGQGKPGGGRHGQGGGFGPHSGKPGGQHGAGAARPSRHGFSGRPARDKKH